MAARGMSLHKVPQFSTTLASAALEWLLLFLLFIHAIFSYLITKFARYCNLQVPCLLCSRLDHILGSERLGFYWDLICRHHKLEISSLIVCHVHNKLVDVHSVCENCLFSFATINKSNAETYRLLVGKLGEEPSAGIDDEQLEDHKHGEFYKRICSCCKELYVPRNHAQSLLESHFDFDDLKNSRKESTRSVQDFDSLPHVEYSKVKYFSDTESEIPFSDDDDGISLVRQTKREYIVPTRPRLIAPPGDLISEKFIHTDLLDLQGQIGNNDPEGSKHVPLGMTIGHGLEEISWLHVEPKVDASSAATNSDSLNEKSPNVIVTQVQESKVPVNGAETVGLNQISGKKVTHEDTKSVVQRESSSEILNAANAKIIKAVPLEQISSGKVNVEEKKPVIEHKLSPEIESGVIGNFKETVESEKISTEIKPVVEPEASPEIPSVSKDKITNTIEMEKKVSEKVTHEELKPVIEHEASPKIPLVVKDKATQTVELEQTSDEKVTNKETKLVIERGPSLEIQPVASDSISRIPDNLELGEAYKLAVGNNRRQLSGKLFEQRSLKDSARLSEDFKQLLSQISAARGIDLPFITSPNLSGNFDEMRNDSSSIIGSQIPQKRISLERNESGLSLDGSVIAEIEGENEFDRLKRQVEHDKRLMNALYKELEEERSASGIAANQAMAMITRLQEEKASLQMEALQCVRMMEEQAEYDVEALQKANDLLAEKEKEMQDLEADLEYFRNKLDDISMLEGAIESTRGLESRAFTAEQSDSNHTKSSEKVESNSTIDKPHTLSKDGLTSNSYSEFEDERLYILECLRKLEKKLHLFSNDGVNLDVADTVKLQTKEDKDGVSKEPNHKDGTQEKSSTDKIKKDGVLKEPNCNERTQEISSKEEIKLNSGVSRMTDAVAIGDAVSNLINKLEALEAERNSVDHSSKSLKKGDQENKQQLGDSLASQDTKLQLGDGSTKK